MEAEADEPEESLHFSMDEQKQEHSHQLSQDEMDDQEEQDLWALQQLVQHDELVEPGKTDDISYNHCKKVL